MKELRELYGLLESLGGKNKQDLLHTYSDENKKAICSLSKELMDEELLPNDVTRDNYIELVYELRKLMIHWSRILGEAIIDAHDKFKKNNIDETIKILEKFTNNCPASFYKNTAQAQIAKYRERSE